ncbi:hypothetical protein MUK42_03152 [Musa troglodytarum]|uniref:Uncharacterized protein n=1 Tax=Musa troglodytarum TaxID=320322 RepID=A0A9E7EW30_9LILI|nr:hypothetical protein MUK42_03152 [Musa troglodytarum]
MTRLGSRLRGPGRSMNASVITIASSDGEMHAFARLGVRPYEVVRGVFVGSVLVNFSSL